MKIFLKCLHPSNPFYHVNFTLKISVIPIITLNNGYINLADVPKASIEIITITGIEIAFLLNSARIDELQPVFLLSGKAKIYTENEEVDILLYLPAISRNF